MKAQILKLAGCKTEKEFYDRYPTQADFEREYGKELKALQKAQNTGKIPAKDKVSKLPAGYPAPYTGPGVKDQGQLRAAPKESPLERLWDIASNPITSFGYAARNEQLPRNLGRGVQSGAVQRNPFDSVLDIYNPTAKPNAAVRGVTNLAKGDLRGAAVEGLGFVPWGKLAGPVGATSKLARGRKAAVKGLEKIVEADSNLATITGQGYIAPTIRGGRGKNGLQMYMGQNGVNITDNNGNKIPDYLENQAPVPQPQPQPANKFSYPQQFPASTGFTPQTQFGSTGKGQFANMEKNISTSQSFKTANPLPSEIDQGQQIQYNMQQEQDRLAKEAAAKQANTPKGFSFDKGMGYARRIVNAIKAKKAQKKARKSAEQWKKVSDVALEASRSEDVNQLADISDEQQRFRDAMMRSVNAEELYPGEVGTNVLTRNGGYVMRGGGEIQNTYDPYTLYNDLGYVPLEDPNRMKAYAYGGNVYPMAQNYGQMISGIMSMFGKGGGAGAATGAASGAAGAAKGAGGTTGFMGKFGNMFGGGSGGGVGTQGIGGGMLGGSGGGGGAMGMMKEADIGAISEAGSAAIANKYGNSAGTQFGGIAGDMVGDIPVYGQFLKPILKPAFTWLGGKLDRDQLRTKRYQKGMRGNLENMAWNAAAKNRMGGLQAMGVARHGANMNPQVIKRFGDMDIDHGIRWFYSDMNTLRHGGNIRSNEVGDLQALSGGELEPISYNPYMDGNGITSRINGQTHEEDNGEHSGVILDYMGNRVEAEDQEIVSEQQDEDGLSAIVSGNQTFNEVGARMLPELSEFKGKKVKHIQRELAERDKKLNKKQVKNTAELNEFTPQTSRDLLRFNALQMNELGLNTKYKQNASKVSKLLAYQEAMNDMAKDYGIDSGEMTRGNIVMADPRAARNGIELYPMAQNSATMNNDERFRRAYAHLTRNISPDAPKFVVPKKTTKKPAPKKMSAADKAKLAEIQDAIINQRRPFSGPSLEDIMADMKAKAAAQRAQQPTAGTPGETVRNNYLPGSIDDPYYNPDYRALETKPVDAVVSGSATRQSTRKEATKSNPQKKATLAKINNPSTPPAEKQAAVQEYVSKYGLVPWTGNKLITKTNPYGKKTATTFTAKEWDQIAENLGFTGHGNKQFQEFLMKNPEAMKLITARHQELYKKDPFIDEKLGYGWAPGELLNLKKAADVTPPADKKDDKTKTNIEVTPKKDNKLATILGQLGQWFRPDPGEELAGEQLAGEMFALGSADVDPVQARFKHSLLDVPYDISYQDKLNENQATFNAIRRSVGNNPEALAQLAAQKYSADSATLAEQFRANQAKKDDVYSKNRAILNADMEANLQIADQQMVRQAQAKSNTKRDIFDALSSMSDKYLQNRLENRTLQTYSNMYKDFGYDKGYRINKYGAPHEFNYGNVYEGDPNSPYTDIPVLDAQGNVINFKRVAKDAQTESAGDDQQTKTETAPPANDPNAVPATTDKPVTPPPLATNKTTAGRNGALVKAFRNM